LLCPNCDGDGQVWDVCHNCNGKGKVKK
jgi:DnaJ-class molecular chaperone